MCSKIVQVVYCCGFQVLTKALFTNKTNFVAVIHTCDYRVCVRDILVLTLRLGGGYKDDLFYWFYILEDCLEPATPTYFILYTLQGNKKINF